jgi:glycosyltransferase involved in cell wall biosynthesis
MKIAVDARTVYSSHRRGTGKNLVDLYRRLATMRPQWQFVMFHRNASVDDPFADLANVAAKCIEMRGDRYELWEQVRLPLAASRAGANVLHCPANTAPRLSSVPLVVSIHDLIALEPISNASEALAWRRRLTRAARNARAILTPSHYSKRSIVRELQVPAAKITVNHWAPDTACRRVTDSATLDSVRAKYGLDSRREYVFAFGASDPRKNTERIIEAWTGLDPILRARHPLLMVGVEGPALVQFRALAESRAPEGHWSINGFAHESDIPPLLSGAALLCYPSLGEGFGLPVLDAFVCGAPVVTSNTTSLPEVAGDAAALVDPADTTAIRDALRRLLVLPDARAALRARGSRRVSEFSWQRVATTAADVMQASAV